MKMARASKASFAKEKKGKGGRGIYSQAAQVWEAVVGLLTAVLGFVRIEDWMFDEVTEVLGEMVWEREEVREVLEAVNRDAVWLVMQSMGKNPRVEQPLYEGFTFVELDTALCA